MRPIAVALAAGAAVALAAPHTASAFCGFYVAGADAKLFNNATQVVMMREGTRTVLSMQNNYQGPPADFAMVVPVPVVLQKANVKTLPASIFSRVDQLAAPRLVEYWEQDPCAYERYEREDRVMEAAGAAPPQPAPTKSADLGVKIEAKFTVGEYQIVILSAKDSTGLETWLHQQKYKIPEGAEKYLRPYVQSGSKFFVAKVDIEKVEMKDGMATLSPLRFFYDSEEFSLPIRLGLMNAKGKQDLIVHILAPNKRYQLANYDNVTIPTNIDVKEAAKQRFGEFYAALFDRTLEKNPKAVVTEYAWDAGSCDPCPTPALDMSELMTLGLDVLDAPMPAAKKQPAKKKRKPRDAVDELRAPPSRGPTPVRPPVPRPRYRNFVLTRLHARYDDKVMTQDLVFKEAPPITGGREVRSGPDGTLQQGSSSSSINNFQARYAIRHPWEGKIDCANPRRGIWGGPPAGVAGSSQPKPALKLAFAGRNADLSTLVAQPVPEVGVAPGSGSAADKPPEEATEDLGKQKTSKKGCQVGGGGGAGALLFVLACLAVLRRRSGSRS